MFISGKNLSEPECLQGLCPEHVSSSMASTADATYKDNPQTTCVWYRMCSQLRICVTPPLKPAHARTHAHTQRSTGITEHAVTGRPAAVHNSISYLLVLL